MNPTTSSRNPWPIAITAYFIVFAAFIAGFTGWAVRQRQDLVAENYYENEIRFQRQFDSANRTQFLAVQTVVTFDPAQKSIVITLPAAQMHGATGSVQLYRPSDARLDREVALALNADGVQLLDGKELRDGLWKVRVKWRVGGEEFSLDQPVIVTSS